MNRNLLEGEEHVATWRGITLTTARVILSVDEGGRGKSVALPLAKIDHTAVQRVHDPRLLYGSFGCAFVGVWTIASDYPGLGGTLLAISCACLLTYFFMRTLQVTIGAGSGRVQVSIVGRHGAAQPALDFVDRVDQLVRRMR